MGLLRILPGWLWLVLAVLIWGAWNHYRAGAASADLALQRAQQAEQRADAMHGALVDVSRTLDRQQKAATDAQLQHRRALAAAVRSAEHGRLLDDAAAGAARAAADPASASERAADGLAEVLGSCRRRYGEVAAAADAAVIAGRECEQRYDALTGR